jgi:predicted Zn-dependent protease
MQISPVALYTAAASTSGAAAMPVIHEAQLQAMSLDGQYIPTKPMRWGHFPVSVWISNDAPMQATDVEKAYSVWEAAAGHSLFVLSYSQSDADITITWANAPFPERINACGQAQCQIMDDAQLTKRSATSYAEITSASLIIIKQAAIDGTLTPEQQTRRWQATIAHEMGHALGLRHVVAENAIMHPNQGWQHTRLSQADRAQWQRCYGS